MSLGYLNRICMVLLAGVLPGAAWADHSGVATLTPNSFLNLETGDMSAATPDILWSGAVLMPQGRAGFYNAGKYSTRVFKSISERHAAAASYGADPIPASSLVDGDVFGVRTNGGHYAKVIVTAAGGASLSLRYTTFIATAIPAAAGGPVPFISQIQNNYSQECRTMASRREAFL
jgi:hypothetical protein